MASPATAGPDGPTGPSGPSETEQPLTFPASYAQERMWFFYRLDARNAFYNVPLLLRFTGGAPDPGVLARALGDLTDRHETLRTTFAETGEGLVQVVGAAAGPALPVVDLTEHGVGGPDITAHPVLRTGLLTEIGRPFDLERGPLLRAVLFRLGPDDHLLLLCVHHIVIDGASAGVLIRELAEAYRARALGAAPGWEPLEIQYGDFAEWQREHLAGERLAEGLDYWRGRLAGDLPVLRLPTDRPRPAQRSFAGDRVDFTLSPDLAEAVKALCRAQGATLYMVLLAAFAALLHRTTGQDDLLVGSPVANRENAQLDPLVGMFVNTLPLRVDASGDPAFGALVQRVREVSLGAFAHQNIPLEKIVEAVAPQRDPGGNPLFQVVFALQNFDRPEIGLPGLTVSPVALADWSCRFDQELHLWEQDGVLRGTLVHATDLFDGRTARRTVERLRLLLAAVTADPALPLSRLPLADGTDVAAADPVDPAAAHPATVAARFAARPATAPAAPAVRAGGAVLDYAGLADRAAGAARRLHARGVGPGDRVALACAAGPDAAAALLAVLQLGAAVVPLDPADPPARTAALLDATAPAVLLADAPGADGDTPAPVLAALTGPAPLLLSTGAHATGAAAGPVPDPPPGRTGPVRGADPAVLLASPDGPVTVTHAELVGQLDRFAAAAGLGPDDTVRWWAPPGTARWIWEALLPLVHGAALRVAPVDADPADADPGEDGDTAEVVLATESQLARLAAGRRAAGPRAVLHAGPALPAALLARHRAALGPGVLRPTHTAPATGPLAVAPADGSGGLRPVRPLRILDGHGAPAPLGVHGAVGLVRPDGTTADTGERGRLTEDGELDPAGPPPGLARLGDHTVRLAPVAARITATEPVRDCALTVRYTTDGTPELVAHVVPTRELDPERVLCAAREALPAAVPLTVSLLPELPRTPGGAPDEAALARIPVPDAALLDRWEAHWRERLGPDRALAVVAAPFRPAGSADDTVRPPVPAPPVPAPAGPAEQGPAAEATGRPDGPPSVSTGAPLERHPEQTLGALLRRVAEQDGAARGLEYVLPDGGTDRQGYPELLDEASRVLGGLRAAGLRPGDQVLLRLAGARQFLTGFWACVLGGFVAVPLAAPAPGRPDAAAEARLEHARRAFGDPLVLTDAAGADELPPECRRAVVEELVTGPADHDPHPAGPDDPVLLMLTSGSTGTPKAVRLRHRNVLTHTAAAGQRHGLGPDDTAVNWMPLDHVGGVVMFHLAFVAAGAAQVHAPTSWVLADPLRWIDLLDSRRATATWAPNFAFGLVNDEAERAAGRSWDLGALRLVLNGGEAVVDRVARRFVRLLAPHGLPAGAMHPIWGMSETSSGEVAGALPGTAGAVDAPTSVGRPFPGFSVRITDDADAPVPEGTVGHLQVSGGAVTDGYHGDPERTREAFTADGWFRTGDLGLLRDGALTLTGRAKDVVIIGGVNHASHELEALAEELAEVQTSFTAACAVRSADGEGDELALFYVLAPGADPGTTARRIRSAVVRGAGVSPSHLIALEREDIPKTELGKIRRSLLRARFEAGEFGGAALGDTLPNWFFAPVWQPAALVHPGGAGGGHTLLVADGAAPAERLADALRAAGHPTTTVLRRPPADADGDAGPADASGGPDAFDAADRAHWDRLLDTLPPLGRIVHLTAGPPADGPGADGVAELTRLAGALAARPDRYGPDRPLALDVVATGSRAVLSTDSPQPRRAPAVALVRSLAQELPWLRARHIDPGPSGPDGPALGPLVAELTTPGTEPDVALRPGRGPAPVRWVRRLRRLPGGEPPARSAPVFRPGGLYVISGGLGGVGVEVARHLLDTHRVRLLLLGRTPLPPAGEWDRRAAEGGEQARRIAAHRELSAAGEIAHAVADVTDAEAVRAAVRAAERAWDTTLAGVLHLAGGFAERPVTEETPELQAAVLDPKIHGGWVLHRLVEETPGALFLSFSSVNGHFGGSGVGSYAAANAYLDALAERQRRDGIDGRSIAWSMWDERGMSRGYALRELTEARGYRILGPREALRSLDTALCHDGAQVVVGLDPRAPWIRAHTLGAVHPLHAPALHLETAAQDPADPVPATPAPAVPGAPADGTPAPADRYGTPTGCPVHPHTALPRTADGLVDRDRLARSGPAPDTGGRPDRPATATERTVAGIWRELLQRDRVGPRDHFFELGGHSILATRMLARLRTDLGVELTVADLFRDPTVEGLAALADRAGRDGTGSAAGQLDVLLPLRPEGTGTPLFCIHPGAGVGWPYAALLGGLDPQRPLWALQARGLRPGSEPAGSVAGMAEDYLRQIRTVHPHGPFHLLGWSFGGLVAFELAARLRAAGEPTGLLALLDVLPLGTLPERRPLPEPAELERVLLGILLASAGARLPEGAEPGREAVLTALQGEGSSLRGLADRDVTALLAVMTNDTELGYGYVPRHYDGDLLYFAAGEDADPARSPAALWQPWTGGRLRVHTVGAAHGDLLRPDRAAEIAHVVETELKAVEAAPGAAPPGSGTAGTTGTEPEGDPR
ncbi:condensation domain-containing protein [Kitasatospora sp. NPDC056327]|uniref:condensation domain-containing protein n=1 Tax=Kitasatospora sp. NPDC056327 TaxID=3345785 RepID=UPI0035DE8EF3